MTRLGEYAFGGQPWIADSQVLRVVPEIVAGHLQLRFNRRLTGTHELAYTLQSAADLQAWSTLDGTELSATSSGIAPGFEQVVFQAAPTVSGTTPLFVRLSAGPP